MRAIPPILLAAYAVTLLALGVVVVLSSQMGIPLTSFLYDPVRVLGTPSAPAQPYVGLFSNIGVLLWCASAAICFLSAGVLPTVAYAEWRRFFWFSGLVSSVLLLDDFFLVHESASEIYWRVTEEVVFALYGVMIVAFLVKCRATILKTEFLPLILAFGFMGLSLVVDQLFDSGGNLSDPAVVLVEDGAKLFGIVSWLVYFSRVAIEQLRGWAVVGHNT